MIRILTTAARIVLGLMFLLPGLTGVVKSSPMTVRPLLGLLATMGYFLPLLSVVYVVAGIMLISGFFVPLGLILLAPVLINIALAHVFLDLTGNWEAFLGVCLELWLLWRYRGCFLGLLSLRGFGNAKKEY